MAPLQQLPEAPHRSHAPEKLNRMIVVCIYLTIAPKRIHTVDGRNPAPVDMENIPLLTLFYTFQVVIAGFLNHQQYPCLYGNFTQVSEGNFWRTKLLIGAKKSSEKTMWDLYNTSLQIVR